MYTLNSDNWLQKKIKYRISGNNVHQVFHTGFVPTKAAELLTLCRQIPLSCHVSTASTEAPQNTGTTPV